ncbi:unnamed protein product, partial [Iphiclides podalirius]
MIMLFKGNSSRLEHLIEKIQANKENHDVTTEDIKAGLGSGNTGVQTSGFFTRSALIAEAPGEVSETSQLGSGFPPPTGRGATVTRRRIARNRS